MGWSELNRRLKMPRLTMSHLALSGFMLLFSGALSAQVCEAERVAVQVLGSGGPELGDGRASSSYLIWLDGKARVMVDAGGGSSLNFERSGARFEDLDAVLFTHLHIDHVADWPAYVKGGYFSERQRHLPVFGPEGNQLLPDIGDFQSRLFTGAWPYMADAIDDTPAPYKLPARAVSGESLWQQELERLSISALSVNHGPLPALAWRVDVAGCGITFSGDTSARGDNLITLAQGSDLLIAHNAIPESGRGIARRLHMPPSRIGEVAAQAAVAELLLSHRMQRTLGREAETLGYIQQSYSGKVSFADDLTLHQLPRQQ